LALQFASAELRNNKEVVLKAIKQYFNACIYASQEIKEEIINLLTK
jgi:hypothetical protein